MALFSFYNVRKPRQFNHKPIYWDPHKEALEERVRKMKREMGMEESLEDYKPQIKGTFIEGTSHLKKSLDRGDDVRSRKYKSAKLIVGIGSPSGCERRGSKKIATTSSIAATAMSTVFLFLSMGFSFPTSNIVLTSNRGEGNRFPIVYLIKSFLASPSSGVT